MTLVDIYAVRDVNGNAAIGDAVLIVGDGTTRIEFKQGHAVAEDSVARLLGHRTDLQIPALAQGTAPVGVPTGPEVPDMEFSPQGVGGDPQAPQEAQAQLAAKEQAVAAAQEHLAQEGEEVPDVIVPAGFELRTADGEMRCLASKADGTQCHNPASEGTHSCGLKRHQELVAERQG